MDDRTRFLLGKMLGLLGSDMDGEILAAAYQIRRLLESKGLSFGDLVALVEGTPVARGRAATASRQESGLQRMADAILKNRSMMKSHERKFVEDIAFRVGMAGNYDLSQKQANWFSYLYAKYGEME